jgi:hypothetical protein
VAGVLEREKATDEPGKTLSCRSGPDPQGSGAGKKQVSGLWGDGLAVGADGESHRKAENQEGNDLCDHSNRWPQRNGFPEGRRP